MRTALLILLAACTGTIDAHFDPPEPDPFDTVDALEQPGPPRYTSRLHGCVKMRYATLGNVLASRGVNLAASDPLSAGAIYTNSAPALGGPNYAARLRENIGIGLATTAKLFDIYIQAAPELIAGIAARPECAGAQLFDSGGRCVARGISCLIGVPATQAHVDVCNDTISRAADPESGRRLAVAVLASAAHTCE
jgi:hypothetical protein